MKLIVGLGNPGEQYLDTRHNLGYLVVDHLVAKLLPATKSNDNFWKFDKKFNSWIGQIEELDLLLVKPETFMNNSGMAVSGIARYFKIQPADIIVVHDELDLKLGQIKVRIGGAAAGHHGVESIINILKTDQFIRVRLGIGDLKTLGEERSKGHFQTDKFVVAKFRSSEKSEVKQMVKKAVEALRILFDEGLSKAQNLYN